MINKLYKVISKLRPMELGDLLRRVLFIKRQVVIVNNSKFLINPASNLGQHLFDHQVYDRITYDLIYKLLQSGDIFLDIGANEGYFSVIGSKITSPDGRVFSLEPQKRLWEIIKKNAELNQCKNISVIPKAIGNFEGTSHITLSPGNNTGLSSMVRLKRRLHWLKQEVSVTTLDKVIDTYKLDNIKLVKIDVEGFDFEVLKSARKSLEQGLIKNIIMEMHPEKMIFLDQGIEDIVEYMESFGYELERIEEAYWFKLV